jgi:predicted transcriptional regulator
MFVLDMFASYDPKEEVEDEYITQFENQIDVETGEVIPVVIPKKHN